MPNGRAMFDWIQARWADGLTVYVHTHTRITKLTPKHSWAIRLKGDHCQMARGKHWDIIDFCKLTAD